jgi:uncharacterized membrane protein YsdA (DUF1294 family)
MSRIRFRIRTIMIMITAVAILMSVFRLIRPWIYSFLEVVPPSVAVFLVVMFGVVVEFFVFWVYAWPRRTRREQIWRITNRRVATPKLVPSGEAEKV